MLVVITANPSRYYSVIEFAHHGKATAIKGLKLIIGNHLQLEATGFGPLKLDHGDYREAVAVFPVEEKVATKQ